MKISQSLIKDMRGDYCPYYLKLKYVDGIETEPTAAMQAGLAFETKLIGASRGGAFEYPKLKNGCLSKAEKDIDLVVDYAKEIFKANNIVINDVQVMKETENSTGAIDAEIEMNGKPMLLDVKYTGHSFAQYEKELQWSSILQDFRLQARQYQSLYKTKLPFLFAVFSKHGWCRMFGITYSDDAITDQTMLINAKKVEFESLYFEPVKDANICNRCRLREICTKKSYKIKLENLERL